MSKTTDNYLNLITSEHRDKPKFTAMVAFSVAVSVQLQAIFEQAASDLFDIDKSPSGVWLDMIGQWAGVSRLVRNPFSGIFFSWDDADADGWDFGIWQDPSSPTAIVSLPDDIYLVLIKAKIAANHWDGTTTDAYRIWQILFPNLNLLIQDNQDMSMVIAVQGSVPDSLTLALLVGGYLPLKPEGVHINEYIVPVDTGPLFGWDLENDFVKGWDEGSWGREIPPT